MKDVECQHKEYKNIIKRMSSTIHDQSSFSNFKRDAEAISPVRSQTLKVNKNETVDGFSSIDSELH